MTRPNINNAEVRTRYEEDMFTEQGLKTLTKLLENYVRYYMTKDVYPFSPIAIFGIPNYRAFINVTTKEDLFGRIKMLSNILGLPSIEIVVDNEVRVADILYLAGEKD